MRAPRGSSSQIRNQKKRLKNHLSAKLAWWNFACKHNRVTWSVGCAQLTPGVLLLVFTLTYNTNWRRRKQKLPTIISQAFNLHENPCPKTKNNALCHLHNCLPNNTCWLCIGLCQILIEDRLDLSNQDLQTTQFWRGLNVPTWSEWINLQMADGNVYRCVNVVGLHLPAPN